MKKGFTIVECLVTLAIVGTLVGLLLPAIYHVRMRSNMEAASYGTFRCLKSFETRISESSSELKVSLKSVDSSKAEVFICDTDELFAQFEDNKYYRVSWFVLFERKHLLEASEIRDFQPEQNEYSPNEKLKRD